MSNDNSFNISGDFIKPIDVGTTDNTPIDINEWAEKYLNDDDYYRYLEAKSRQDTLLEDAKSSGLLMHEPVIETFYSNILKKNISITVGVKVIVREGETLQLDDEYMNFEKRYSESPEINYIPVL